MKPGVLIAESHDFVSRGIKRGLRNDFEVVGSVEDGRKLLAETLRCRPDVIVLEITMPVPNGIEIVSRLHISLPDTKLIFVTEHMARHYVWTGRADGFLQRQSAGMEVGKAVAAVLAGRFYVSPALARDLRVISAIRKREVLQMTADGKTTNDVAQILGTSPENIELNKRAIMRSLGLNTIREMVQYAIDNGMIAVRAAEST